MKAVYNDSSVPEKEAKARYFFPENIMMENAASALEREIDGFFGTTNNSECRTDFCDDNNFKRKNDFYTCHPNHAKSILILCGSGNNGGDGLALARRIYGKYDVKVVLISAPKTDEAKTQLKMAQSVGVEILELQQFEQITNPEQNTLKKSDEPFVNPVLVPDVIVDCIFGTGFHGELPANIKSLLEKINESPEYKSAYKIACDIPSALYFKADVTVTMGALKSILFSDKAKDVTGKIKVADLGINNSIFEKCAAPDAFLIEEIDAKFPLRTKKSAHKGTYGHTAVFAGEKSGAAIIAAESALAFGSGLTTLVKSERSNLEQFKITPELMISDSIPKTTTAILLGPGLGTPDEKTLDAIKEWFKAGTDKAKTQTHAHTATDNPASNTSANQTSRALVLDADMLSYPKIVDFLKELCETSTQNTPAITNSTNHTKSSSTHADSVSIASALRIILTPHPKELATLYSALGFENYTAVQAAQNRFKIAEKIIQKFPQLTLIMKSANTIIAQKSPETNAKDFSDARTESQKTTKTSEVDFYIVAEGTPALAKGGSGDVLAGMTASLLAQGYSAKDAAITAVYAHAIASTNFSGGMGWNLSPQALIGQISALTK
ncbi:MAG: NAD(P)H-hydrate epimerase [Treponema sp.]|nr:NAD(P)H-hydrate epimerase [Treponema sp.]